MPTQTLTRFEKCIGFVFANEGTRYTADPADNGKCSRYGVTQAALSKWRGKPVTCDDVRALTQDEAETLYKVCYYDALHLDSVGSDAVATALLDMAVLCGTRTATRIMQLCVGAAPDYNLGPKTLAAINAAAGNDLILRYSQSMQSHFAAIVRVDAKQAKWLYGWLCRSARIILLSF